MIFPEIFPVTAHTKYVGPGSLFVAIKGYQKDGADYIVHAIEKGATKVVVQKEAVLPKNTQALLLEKKVEIMRVEDPRLALAELSAEASGYPTRKLKIIGITGTKGKTTTSFLLEHMLKSAGYKTALLSTIKNSILDTDFKAELTTQQPDYLHQFFRLCVENNIDYVVMEVAAQALSLYRVATIQFDGIIFTNFDQEHAEFYDSLDDYFSAKCLLFKQAKKDAPILINADDLWLQKYSSENTMPSFYTYRVQSKAQDKGKKDIEYRKNMLGSFCAKDVSTHPYISYAFIFKQKDTQKVEHNYRFECPRLMGEFNIYNCLAASCMSMCLEVAPESIERALQSFTPLPGRLERYRLPNGALCFIDYAHNPNSYEAVLSSLRKITTHLIVVFGAGGDKDKIKRPLMGKIAAQYADLVVLTSDNPRTEDPQTIIHDIMVGISLQKNVMCELDRTQAIAKAYTCSYPCSVIAVLGKGPDEYQIIGNTSHYFSDKEVVLSLR